jgi:hypothetical protein
MDGRHKRSSVLFRHFLATRTSPLVPTQPKNETDIAKREHFFFYLRIFEEADLKGSRIRARKSVLDKRSLRKLYEP